MYALKFRDLLFDTGQVSEQYSKTDLTVVFSSGAIERTPEIEMMTSAVLTDTLQELTSATKRLHQQFYKTSTVYKELTSTQTSPLLCKMLSLVCPALLSSDFAP